MNISKIKKETAAYFAILRRKPSTSSRMFREKNLGNSVDDGVSDSGGMCCKAFLEKKEQWQQPELTCFYKHVCFIFTSLHLTVCFGGQCEPELGSSPSTRWPGTWAETGTRWPKRPRRTPLYSWWSDNPVSSVHECACRIRRSGIAWCLFGHLGIVQEETQLAEWRNTCEQKLKIPFN